MIGGAFKLVDPTGTVGALRALGVPANAGVVRALAATELVIGALALAVSGTVVAALVAVSYLAFAGFTIRALRRGVPIDTCGCLGRLETPPTWRHLVVVGAVIIGAVAQALDPTDALLERLGSDLADGLATAGVAVALTAVAVITMRAGRRPSTPR